MNSRLGLGTAQFGLTYGINNQIGKTSSLQVKKILNLSSLSGIKIIDTAMSYGNSEEMLGIHDLSGFNIVTKLSPLQGELKDINQWIESSVRKSIEKLNFVLLFQI